jgi:hypothetical protein
MERNTWVKSSFSNGSGGNNCVEVLQTNSDEMTIFVRNSKDRLRDSAMFTRDEWRAFLAGAKAGEFDID